MENDFIEVSKFLNGYGWRIRRTIDEGSKETIKDIKLIDDSLKEEFVDDEDYVKVRKTKRGFKDED